MKLKKGALAKVNTGAMAILKKKGIAMDADLTPEEIKELVNVVAENIEHTVEDTEEVEKLVGAEDEEDEKETAEDEDDQTEADRDNESEAMRLKEREKREEKDRDADKKAAMDAAIKTAEDSAVARVTALFEAREMVKPLVGVVAMDSAEAVFKHALDKSGVDTKGVHSSAYKSMVGLVIKQKAQPQVKTAMDAASYEDDPLTSRFK